MNFTESENQKAIRATVRDFAQREISPHRMDWDERQHFPRELFTNMGALGLLGMLVPEEYGRLRHGIHGIQGRYRGVSEGVRFNWSVNGCAQ
jgi:alkylation response protein AidB-like acyl-CoA dehydrogenase